MDVGDFAGSSVFSKSSLNIWKFMVHILLKPGLENFEHYFASMWDECNCVVVWAFFGIAFLWDWNENTFSSLVATAEFSKFVGIFSAALSQHHLLGFQKLNWNSITSTSFVRSDALTHLTSHSRKCDSRWVIISLWLSGSWSAEVQPWWIQDNTKQGWSWRLEENCLIKAMERD